MRASFRAILRNPAVSIFCVLSPVGNGRFSKKEWNLPDLSTAKGTECWLTGKNSFRSRGNRKKLFDSDQEPLVLRARTSILEESLRVVSISMDDAQGRLTAPNLEVIGLLELRPSPCT